MLKLIILVGISFMILNGFISQKTVENVANTAVHQSIELAKTGVSIAEKAKNTNTDD